MATRTRPRTKDKQPRARSDKQPRRGDRQTPSRLGDLQRIARETVAEVKKITWPDRETTRNLTLVVIAISVILGLLLGAVDAAFVRLWGIF